MTTPRIEEMVEEFKMIGIWWGETDDTAELEPIEDILHKMHFEDEGGNKVDLLIWLKQALTQAHQAGYADGYERGKQARIEDDEVEVRDSMCDYWYKKGRDEAGSLMYAQMEDWLYLREATDERTTVADVMNKLKALQDNK